MWKDFKIRDVFLVIPHCPNISRHKAENCYDMVFMNRARSLSRPSFFSSSTSPGFDLSQHTGPTIRTCYFFPFVCQVHLHHFVFFIVLYEMASSPAFLNSNFFIVNTNGLLHPQVLHLWIQPTSDQKSLLQWIFPTQESNQSLLHCRQILDQLSYQGSPVATPVFLGFPCGSAGTECNVGESWVGSLSWEDPLEKGEDTHTSILAWRIPWTVESMGSQRVGHK